MAKKFLTVIITAVVFFIVTMPFRELFNVLGVTEMRPASALPPTFGLLFGIPGALGCAIGNLFADIASGYNSFILVWGFVAQFIYGILPYVLWKFISKSEIRLKNVKNILQYIVIILINSVAMAVMFWFIVRGYENVSVMVTAAIMVFFNNFVFSMLLGIPIIIFTTARKAEFSLNERLVLILIFISVVKAGLIGTFAYTELSQIIADPLTMWNRIYVYVAISLFISYIITILILRYAEKNITIPIESIADIVKHYVSKTKKKEGTVVVAECEKFKGIRNETGILASAFQTMVLDLEAYIDNLTKITAERERISAELDVATRIQVSMLPCIFPPFPDRDEFELFASMSPAKEVGGDFYDFFLVDNNTLAVVMADVSGKGVPAALFMVIAKTLIKNNAQEGKSPKEVFNAVNNLLCENNDEGMFVTAFMGYLDITGRKFTYVNAGHDFPLIRENNQYVWLENKPELFLAALHDTSYTEHELTLPPDSLLLLYTDGVTEAMNRENELFSACRLLEKANENPNCSVKKLVAKLKEEVNIFADGAEQADDITMLALEVK